MDDCLFCKMVEGEIEVDRIFENEHILAFKDINPQSPVHILFIPKKHISTILDLEDSDKNIMGELFMTANKIAMKEGIDQNGFRLVINCKEHGGQAVFHLHLHLLGGRQFKWPPG